MAVSVKYLSPIVDYICDPNIFSFCNTISQLPDNVQDSKVPTYWGLLGLTMITVSSVIAGSDGFGFTLSISQIGWELMNIFSYVLWVPVIIFWIPRFFVNDNDTLNWLFVIFSNFTMTGPILGYWLSIILVPIGWISNSIVSPLEIFRWFLWIVVIFFASFY